MVSGLIVPMTNSAILDFAIQGFKFDCSIVNLMKQWYQKNNSSYPKTLNIMYKLPFYGVSSFSVDHNGTTAAILDFVHTGFKFNCSNDNLIKYQHQKWIPHTLKPLKSCTGRPYMVLILIFCWPNSTTAAILDFVVLCVKFDCYNDNLITQKTSEMNSSHLKTLKIMYCMTIWGISWFLVDQIGATAAILDFVLPRG